MGWDEWMGWNLWDGVSWDLLDRVGWMGQDQWVGMESMG